MNQQSHHLFGIEQSGTFRLQECLIQQEECRRNTLAWIATRGGEATRIARADDRCECAFAFVILPEVFSPDFHMEALGHHVVAGTSPQPRLRSPLRQQSIPPPEASASSHTTESESSSSAENST